MNNKKLSQPHDSYARYILSDIEVAKAIMKSHLLPNMVKRINWTTLQLANKSFVNKRLRQLHSDVIYRCTLDDGKTHLYWICEHQSTQDKKLPLRTLEYMVMVMRQHMNEGHEKLPLVMCTSIYAGVQSPYSEPVDIYDCFEDSTLARECMFQSMKLVDLTIVSQEKLLQDKTAGLVQVVLQQGIKRDHLDWVNNNRELINQLMGSKFGETSFIYLLGTDDNNDPNELMQAIMQAAPQYNDTIMTAARQLEIRGEKIGKKIGEQARNLAIAQNMLKKGYSVQSIQEITDLSKEAIEKLKEGGLLNHR
jgi:predicted transposase/invertase (TIGR01784 family)